MSAEQITNATYDQIASTYAERYWNTSLNHKLKRFTEAVRLNGKVLDLGCGPGRDVALLSERGLNVIGLDRSLGMLAEAQRRVPAGFACADMRRIPLASAHLDGIWMCDSLLHVPRMDVPNVLNEAGRILTTNGVLFISVRQGDGDEWSDSDGGRRYFTLFQLDELLGLLTQAKFIIREHSLDVIGHSTWISVLSIRDNR
jgi:ubiquinone/menaquinone biosynthesis C-methylase UbiE